LRAMLRATHLETDTGLLRAQCRCHARIPRMSSSLVAWQHL
jgi:hypothetical protein